MSSIGSALFAHLQTDNGFDVHPTQIPNKAFATEDAVSVAYMVLPGDGPIRVMDEAVPGEVRTESVRVSLMVRSRSYLALEAAVVAIVRLMDRVVRATWGGVLIQSSEVIGWQDTPMEPETDLLQTVIDARIKYDEVAA